MDTDTVKRNTARETRPMLDSNPGTCDKALAFSHLADALVQSDLESVQGHSPVASRVKCLVQGHNVIWHGPGIKPITF